jgi:hypothetical protein
MISFIFIYLFFFFELVSYLFFFELVPCMTERQGVLAIHVSTYSSVEPTASASLLSPAADLLFRATAQPQSLSPKLVRQFSHNEDSAEETESRATRSVSSPSGAKSGMSLSSGDMCSKNSAGSADVASVLFKRYDVE